jgi:hypothetical protein
MQRPEEKSFAPAEDQTPVVQSVIRHHTDLVTPDHNFICTPLIYHYGIILILKWFLERVYHGVKRIKLDQDTVQWRAFLNTVMNHRVPKK